MYGEAIDQVGKERNRALEENKRLFQENRQLRRGINSIVLLKLILRASRTNLVSSQGRSQAPERLARVEAAKLKPINLFGKALLERTRFIGSARRRKLESKGFLQHVFGLVQNAIMRRVNAACPWRTAFPSAHQEELRLGPVQRLRRSWKNTLPSGAMILSSSSSPGFEADRPNVSDKRW